MKPLFFKTPADLRKWFEKNHAKQTEVLIGFYKVGTGKPSIIWSEAVDQAICFGWIDSVRKSIDEHSYSNRFTPRKPKSNWSAINIAKVKALTEQGLMHPTGQAAYEKRDDARSVIYAFEQQKETVKLDTASEKIFKANKKAWKNFNAMPPWYIRTATWQVLTAKQEVTKLKRLEALIKDSEAGLAIKELRRRS